MRDDESFLERLRTTPCKPWGPSRPSVARLPRKRDLARSIQRQTQTAHFGLAIAAVPPRLLLHLSSGQYRSAWHKLNLASIVASNKSCRFRTLSTALRPNQDAP